MIRALGQRAVAIQASVGIPASVGELFAECGKPFRPASTSWSAMPPAGAQADDGDDAQALALVPPGDERALDAEPADATRLAADEGRWPIVALFTSAPAAMPATASHRRVQGCARALARALAQELGPARHPRQRGQCRCPSTPMRHRLIFPAATRCSPTTPRAHARDGLVLTRQDVAGAVACWHACPRAGMINGHTLVVDGFAISGWSMAADLGIAGQGRHRHRRQPRHRPRIQRVSPPTAPT